MFWVYVFQNPESKIYIGQTDRLEWRICQHNDPKHTLSKTTKRIRGPWKLICSENFPTRSEALRREKQLKSSRGRAWIRSAVNPSADGKPKKAESTGLEPATSAVTGQRSNQLSYAPAKTGAEI